jgi:hypothetical protein
MALVHQDADGEWRNAYGNVVVCGECRRRIEPDGAGYRHRCSYHSWNEPAPALDGGQMCPPGARDAWRGVVRVMNSEGWWL